MRRTNALLRLSVCLPLLGVTYGCGGGDSSSSSGPTGTATPTPAPATISLTNVGPSFYVDDTEIKLKIGPATAGGDPITATSLSLSSDLQGQIADNLTPDTAINFRLNDGAHKLTLTGDFGANGTASATLDILVLPRHAPIPETAKRAGQSDRRVPVVVVTYIPTEDGVNLDTSVADYNVIPADWSDKKVQSIIDYSTTLSVRSAFMLTEMSRFRGHKDNTQPYLGYEVVDHIIYYKPYPQKDYPRDPSQKIFDYKAALGGISAQRLVENEGVKEFWLMTYFAGDDVKLWESNMASPTTGDISNSDRAQDDLPIYANTYIVYGNNYHRTQAEAVHNHGHQIEAMLDYLDLRANGLHDLFWGSFVGWPSFPSGSMTPGSCGWTHSPPYTNENYGYLNGSQVQSNCEDWNPDGTGATTLVSANYMDSLGYNWPGGNPPQKVESNFYIWWGQNIPGKNNNVKYGGRELNNWWELLNDWDDTSSSSKLLYK